jgi:hypothetical protein
LDATHYIASAYDELEAVMRNKALDFVQLDYSLDDRVAECCEHLTTEVNTDQRVQEFRRLDLQD